MIQISQNQLDDQLDPYREVVINVISLLKESFIKKMDEKAFSLISRMYGRIKSPDSILEKISRKKLNIFSLDDIFNQMKDIAGIRITTTLSEESSQIENIISSISSIRIVSKEQKNMCSNLLVEVLIKNIFVPCEIQIRPLLHEFSNIFCFKFLHKASQVPEKDIQILMKQLNEKLLDVDLIAQTLYNKTSSDASGQQYTSYEQHKIFIVIVGDHENVLDWQIISGEKNFKSIKETKNHLRQMYPNFASVIEGFANSLYAVYINEPHLRFHLK